MKYSKNINTTFYIQGIDVLVHCAGIVVNGSTIELPLSEYDRCMNINARSAFILTKECLPHLLKTKGNIVHVSSVTGTNENTIAFHKLVELNTISTNILIM